MRIVSIVFVLAIAAVAATYWRYQSFDPCDWMAHDLEEQTGLPELIVQARIKAYFLLDGVADPGPQDCLLAWWEVRREGLPES